MNFLFVELLCKSNLAHVHSCLHDVTFILYNAVLLATIPFLLRCWQVPVKRQAVEQIYKFTT